LHVRGNGGAKGKSVLKEKRELIPVQQEGELYPLCGLYRGTEVKWKSETEERETRLENKNRKSSSRELDNSLRHRSKNKEEDAGPIKTRKGEGKKESKTEWGPL